MLVAYRLRSDDLELMEREVYEELKIKKEVEQFQKRQKRIDELKNDAEVITKMSNESKNVNPLLKQDSESHLVGEAKLTRPK